MAQQTQQGTPAIAPLFALVGEVVISPTALELLTSAGVSPRILLERHASGNFGLVVGRAARENLLATKTGVRVLSRYAVGEKRAEVWIVTDKSRSSTRVLDPSDYGVGQ